MEIIKKTVQQYTFKSDNIDPVHVWIDEWVKDENNKKTFSRAHCYCLLWRRTELLF